MSGAAVARMHWAAWCFFTIASVAGRWPLRAAACVRRIATLCDYADARRLLAQPMARGLSGKLQDSVREFYKLLNKQTFAEDDYTTADAAKKTKQSIRTAQRHLRALAGAGYVRQVEPGRGARPAIWAPEPNAPAEISDLNILPEILSETNP